MWNVLGASVTGTSHAVSGMPCQDYCRHSAFTVDGRKYLALALSDGAGSATHSHLGSKIAVRTALQSIRSIARRGGDFDREDALHILDAARRRVFQTAEAAALKPRHLACTLLFAVLTNERSVFAQLGDGAWVAATGSSLVPVTWPLRWEYENETVFLTSESCIAGFQFESLPGSPDSVAGFTDGIQSVALNYAARAVHAPFFAQLFHVLKNAAEPANLRSPLINFLSLESLNRRTDDDKTLILAVRRNLCFLGWDTSTRTARR